MIDHPSIHCIKKNGISISVYRVCIVQDKILLMNVSFLHNTIRSTISLCELVTGFDSTQQHLIVTWMEAQSSSNSQKAKECEEVHIRRKKTQLRCLSYRIVTRQVYASTYVRSVHVHLTTFLHGGGRRRRRAYIQSCSFPFQAIITFASCHPFIHSIRLQDCQMQVLEKKCITVNCLHIRLVKQ